MPHVEEIASLAINHGFRLHSRLGPGLLESAYETLLGATLKDAGLKVERQKPIALTYEAIHIPDAFRADLVIEDSLIIEVKSTERHAPVHAKQLLTYLRLTEQPLGLLLNFGCETFRDGLKRVVNGPAKRFAGRGR